VRWREMRETVRSGHDDATTTGLTDEAATVADAHERTLGITEYVFRPSHVRILAFDAGAQDPVCGPEDGASRRAGPTSPTTPQPSQTVTGMSSGNPSSIESSRSDSMCQFKMGR
jgi:hypothetical protein